MKLLIITGRSCSGKTYLVNEILSKYDIHKPISITTREQRPGEVNGRDYYFIPKEQFNKDTLIDYIEYNNNYYGLTEDSFDYTKDNIIIVEPNGVINLKNKLKDKFKIITIKLDAPDEVILERLNQRGSTDRFNRDKEWFKDIEADIEVMYPNTLNYEEILKER